MTKVTNCLLVPLMASTMMLTPSCLGGIDDGDNTEDSTTTTEDDTEGDIDTEGDPSTEGGSDTESENDTESESDTEDDTNSSSDSNTDPDSDSGQKNGDPCNDNPWDCDPVTNEGCDPEQACDFLVDSNNVSAFFCLVADAGQEGDSCNQIFGPWCKAGHACVKDAETEGDGTCRKYCCADEDCPEPETCEPIPHPIWEPYVTGDSIGVCLGDATETDIDTDTDTDTDTDSDPATDTDTGL